MDPHREALFVALFHDGIEKFAIVEIRLRAVVDKFGDGIPRLVGEMSVRQPDTVACDKRDGGHSAPTRRWLTGSDLDVRRYVVASPSISAMSMLVAGNTSDRPSSVRKAGISTLPTVIERFRAPPIALPPRGTRNSRRSLRQARRRFRVVWLENPSAAGQTAARRTRGHRFDTAAHSSAVNPIIAAADAIWGVTRSTIRQELWLPNVHPIVTCSEALRALEIAERLVSIDAFAQTLECGATCPSTSCRCVSISTYPPRLGRR